MTTPELPEEAVTDAANPEEDAWDWLERRYIDHPSDLAFDANEMVDAFIAGTERAMRAATQPAAMPEEEVMRRAELTDEQIDAIYDALERAGAHYSRSAIRWVGRFTLRAALSAPLPPKPKVDEDAEWTPLHERIAQMLMGAEGELAPCEMARRIVAARLEDGK